MTKSDSHPDPKSFLGVGSCKRIQIQTDPNSRVAKLCDRFHTKNNFYPTFYIYSILLFYCMYREKSTNLPSRTKFLKHFFYIYIYFYTFIYLNIFWSLSRLFVMSIKVNNLNKKKVYKWNLTLKEKISLQIYTCPKT